MTTIAIGVVRRQMARLDPLLAAVLALAIVLGLAAPIQLVNSFEFVGTSLLDIAPAFLLAVGLGAWVKAAGADGLVARVFAGNATATIIAASLFGALSPFCSCGVVPLVAALLAAGVPLAPVMAFCLSSPLMDPQTFFIVAGAFGVDFALVKVASAIAIGLGGGFAVLGLQRLGYLDSPLRADRKLSGCAARKQLKRDRPQWLVWRDPARLQSFTAEFRGFGWWLLKIMILAFTLESLMVAYLPADTVVAVAGSDSVWAIPLAALVGVPAYLNSLAAIPLISGLVGLGMGKGAALTFLTAGAVSSLPAAAAVYSLVRPPVFAAYLGLAFLGSLAVGWLYELGLAL